MASQSAAQVAKEPVVDNAYYTIPQTSGLTGFSLAKIFRDMRSGRLRVCRVGRRTVITGRQIRQWIEGSA